MANQRTSKPLIALTVTWAFGLCAGLSVLAAYHLAPSDPGVPATSWPTDSPLRLDTAKFNLVVFLHPKCPCSLATVSEVHRILSSAPENVTATAVFTCPWDGDESWTSTPLMDRCREISGMSVVIDDGGLISKQFGIETSGTLNFYDRRGVLQYSGGVTPSRGHEGMTFAKSAIIKTLKGEACDFRNGPVFGCGLVIEESERRDSSTAAGNRDLAGGF